MGEPSESTAKTIALAPWRFILLAGAAAVVAIGCLLYFAAVMALYIALVALPLVGIGHLIWG